MDGLLNKKGWCSFLAYRLTTYFNSQPFTLDLPTFSKERPFFISVDRSFKFKVVFVFHIWPPTFAPVHPHGEDLLNLMEPSCPVHVYSVNIRGKIVFHGKHGKKWSGHRIGKTLWGFDWDKIHVFDGNYEDANNWAGWIQYFYTCILPVFTVCIRKRAKYRRHLTYLFYQKQGKRADFA